MSSSEHFIHLNMLDFERKSNFKNSPMFKSIYFIKILNNIKMKLSLNNIFDF